MGHEHVILCGGVQPHGRINRNSKFLTLNVGHAKADIKLRVKGLCGKFIREVSPVFQDLMEIATYVYCADKAVSRDGADADTFWENWRRVLHFHIPVRCPDVWKSAQVDKLLSELLNFLSDDTYCFNFYAAENPMAFQRYLDLTDADAPRVIPEQVILFSGDLDSLAGAVQECVVEKRRIVLVNHRTTPSRHDRLLDLQRTLFQKAGSMHPMCVNVEIDIPSDLHQEYTQLSRAFLYASLGAVVARMLGLSSMRFYENGIVSLNLPVCAQVVGGRATRTTHPKTLRGFQDLLSLLAGESYTVENPFVWETKGQIIQRLLNAGCDSLLAASISCTQLIEDHAHCGICFECIDRRMGIIAAGADSYESSAQYRTNIFTESLTEIEDKTMLATYIERANRIRTMRKSIRFMRGFPEIARALRYLGTYNTQTLERVFDLHKKHAEEVMRAVTAEIGRHSEKIVSRTLPGDCLLRIVYESNSVISLPCAKEPELTLLKPIGQYSIRRGMNVWQVIFDGVEVPGIGKNRGMFYIAYLLKNAGSPPIHALELEAKSLVFLRRECGMPELVDQSTGQTETLDADAVFQELNLSRDDREIERRLLQEERKALAVIKTSRSENEKRLALEKVQHIRDFLQLRFRAGTTPAYKAAKRVRTAIDRLCDDLRNYQDGNQEATLAAQAFANFVDGQIRDPSARLWPRNNNTKKGAQSGLFQCLKHSDIEWFVQ